MKLRPLGRDELRELDRRAIEQFGIPGIVLMENAGREAARWLVELGIAGPIVICCGKGNNGGDGCVIARHLDAWGHSVRVLVACDPAELRGDALVNFRIIQASGIPITCWSPGTPQPCSAPNTHDSCVSDPFRDAAWIVDALIGTGARGEVRGLMRSAIEAINAASAGRFAIDIPSGLDCDTGRPLGVAVRASHTATFVSSKLGFTRPEAAAYTGAVRVFDIGIPAKLLREYGLAE